MNEQPETWTDEDELFVRETLAARGVAHGGPDPDAEGAETWFVQVWERGRWVATGEGTYDECIAMVAEAERHRDVARIASRPDA